SVSGAGSGAARSTKRPRQPTPARPTSSIRLASVSGPLLIAGAAAKPRASRKNATAPAVSRSILRDLGGVSAMAAASASGDSFIRILSQWVSGRTRASLSHDEADDLGHRLVVGGRDHVVDLDGGVERAGQRRVLDHRHLRLLGDLADLE